MSWTLTIGGVPVQSYVRPFSSLKPSYRGYKGIGTLSVRLVEQSPYTLDIVNESVVSLVDSGSTTFGGYVRRRVRTDLNVQNIRIWEIECQDFNSDPSDDFVPLGIGPRTVVETDQARVRWLFNTYGTRSVDATTAYCRNALAANLPPMDFQGMTLAAALNLICSYTGAQWYVDFQHRLHYFITETDTAPWSINVQSPNGTTSFPCKDFSYPDDTIDYVNTVLVIGGGVTATRYRDGTPPPAGTRRLYILQDSSLSTVSACETAGDQYLAGQGNQQSGKLTVWKAGLLPGQLLTIVNSQWSLNGAFRISEVVPRYIDLDKAFYDITFGANPISLQDLWSKQSSQIVAISGLAERLEAQEVDVTPPSVPSGLGVDTGTRQAADGSMVPYLLVSWSAVADADLDAYEVEVDRAIEGAPIVAVSASGTGGTLAAGDYVVQVTGVGAVAGETLPSGVQLQTITAGQRLYVNITAKTGCTNYKVYAKRGGALYALTTSTTGSNVEIPTEGSGAAPPTASTAVAFTNPKPFRTAGTSVVTEDVQGGVYYAARVRAVDDSGNRSAWTSPQGITTAPDNTAPAIPEGLVAYGGFRLIGANWQRNSESDLGRYQLRFAPESAPESGVPDTEAWTVLSTTSTLLVISNLDPEVLYFLQVRAIDRSGNCVTSAGDPTAVQAEANPEAGWSNTTPDWVTARPSLVGAADVAFNTVLTNILSANQINADDIRAGTLSIGGSLDTPDYLIVYDNDGDEIGRWDANGLTITDPTNPDRIVRLMNGIIEFSSDGGVSWVTAIGPEGIIADSIKLGIAPGGHNAIPNASFELTAFSTTFSRIWTLTTDWDDATSQVNLNVTTGDLKLTTYTY